MNGWIVGWTAKVEEEHEDEDKTIGQWHCFQTDSLSVPRLIIASDLHTHTHTYWFYLIFNCFKERDERERKREKDDRAEISRHSGRARDQQHQSFKVHSLTRLLRPAWRQNGACLLVLCISFSQPLQADCVERKNNKLTEKCWWQAWQQRQRQQPLMSLTKSLTD